MNSKVVLAIVAAVVVVAAGAGAVVLLTKDNGGGSTTRLDGMLEVYGNANEDYVINSDDTSIIKKIIEKEEGYTLDKYPFADANHDGSVDEADVNLVKDIIDGKATRVYHVNHVGTSTTVTSTAIPIKGCIALSSADMLGTLKVVGAEGLIKGVSSTNYISEVLFPTLAAKHLTKMGASTMKIDTATALALKESDPTVTAILCPDNASYIKDNETELAKTFDIVRVIPGSGVVADFVSCTLTLGFLFGMEERANDIVDWYNDVYTHVASKVNDDNRVTAITINTVKNVCTDKSPYTGVILAAGASYTFGDLGTGDPTAISRSFDKASDNWLYAVNVDYLAHNSVQQYAITKETIATLKESTMANYSMTKAYDDGHYFLFDGSMPVPVRVAYVAEQFYGEELGAGYGDKMHQDFIDKFFTDMKDFKVTDHIFVVTSKDLQS